MSWDTVGDYGCRWLSQVNHVGRFVGPLRRAGVEGTGTCGAALLGSFATMTLKFWSQSARPGRASIQRESDPTDAENAARAVLSGMATAVPKEHSGAAEAMRSVSVTRRSAVKARLKQSINCEPHWSAARRTSAKEFEKKRLTVYMAARVFVL
jgi:hypothetical protein